MTQMSNNSRRMSQILQKYRVVDKKGEGTFAEVLKCQDLSDGTFWACKKMKQKYQSLDQVNTLREIQAMRKLQPHANILDLKEIIFEKKTGTLMLICELMDMNVYELIKDRRTYLSENYVRKLGYQLLKSVQHMHRNGIFHRDIKPENILIKGDILKLADFGSCRGIFSKQPYTEYISTRWYRSPECLLTDGYYSFKMDLWSIGCVFYEIISLRPLFPGANEVDQISKIHDTVGTPESYTLNKFKHRNKHIDFNFPLKKGTGLSKLLPRASPEVIDLIGKLCTYDPDDRITAKAALKHPYFQDLREADRKALMERKHNAVADKKKTDPKKASSTQQQTQPVDTTSSLSEILTKDEVVPAKEVPEEKPVKTKPSDEKENKKEETKEKENKIIAKINDLLDQNDLVIREKRRKRKRHHHHHHRKNMIGGQYLLPSVGKRTNADLHISLPKLAHSTTAHETANGTVLPSITALTSKQLKPPEHLKSIYQPKPFSKLPSLDR